MVRNDFIDLDRQAFEAPPIGRHSGAAFYISSDGKTPSILPTN